MFDDCPEDFVTEAVAQPNFQARQQRASECIADCAP
jgi:hypothetical protein